MDLRKGSVDRGVLTIIGFMISMPFLVAAFGAFYSGFGVLTSSGDTAAVEEVVSQTREKCSIAADDTEEVDDFQTQVSFQNLESMSIEDQSDGPDVIVSDMVDSTYRDEVSGCDLSIQDTGEGDSKIESGSWGITISCESNCGGGSGQPEIKLTASRR